MDLHDFASDYVNTLERILSEVVDSKKDISVLKYLLIGGRSSYVEFPAVICLYGKGSICNEQEKEQFLGPGSKGTFYKPTGKRLLLECLFPGYPGGGSINGVYSKMDSQIFRNECVYRMLLGLSTSDEKINDDIILATIEEFIPKIKFVSGIFFIVCSRPLPEKAVTLLRGHAGATVVQISCSRERYDYPCDYEEF